MRGLSSRSTATLRALGSCNATLDGPRETGLLYDRCRETHALAANGDAALALNELAFISFRTTTEATRCSSSRIFRLESTTFFLGAQEIDASAAHSFQKGFESDAARDFAQDFEEGGQRVFPGHRQATEFAHVKADARALRTDCLEFSIATIASHGTNPLWPSNAPAKLQRNQIRVCGAAANSQ